MKLVKVRTTMIFLILIVALGTVYLLQKYTLNSVNTVSENTVISLLSDNANQVKRVLDNQIKNIWIRLDMVDSALTGIGDMSSQEAVSYLQDSVADAYRIELVSKEGEFLDQNGKRGYIEPTEKLYPMLWEGERICVLSQESEQDMLLFGMPISNVTIEQTPIHYLMVYYELDVFMKLLSVESFAGEGQIRVVNSEGLVLLYTDNLEEDKKSYYFFKIFEKACFVESQGISDFEEFHDSVLNGENHAVHAVVDDEKDVVISYAKVTDMDWFVTIVVDYESVLGGLNDGIRSIGRNTIVATMAVVILASALVIAISLDIQKIRHEKQELQKMNQSLECAKQVTEDALKIAESANKSKSYFLSNMSHDIRTPMNAIMGFATLLGRNADNPNKVREYTNKIVSSSHHLLGLINDVLDMSKIESGKTTLNLSEESISNIVYEIDTIIRPQMDEKGHDFEIIVHDIIHENIIVDKMRLNQILFNLLSNAVKYTQAYGHVRLEISELRASGRSAQYRMVISDNGYGMSEEFQKKIFGAFCREEDSRTSKIQGTGLGMTITKNLLDLMGGSIKVESKKGEGSTFTVDFQFQIGHTEDDEQFWRKKGISHCLVVDEEETICRNIVSTMDNTDIKVDYALSGRQALEKIHGMEAYQVILVNWKLPDMDGMDLIKRIRTVLPEKKVIILFMSNDRMEMETSDWEGIIDGILSKPFFMRNFRNKLEDILMNQNEPIVVETIDEGDILEGRHILVAEDNELNAEILVDLLEIAGVTCDICENGRLVVDTFENSVPGEYDLILMDVQMPVLNGYEATREIREGSHSMARTIPIIAMTANAFAEDVREALAAGMNAHIAKPVNLDTLMEVVKSVVTPIMEKG